MQREKVQPDICSTVFGMGFGEAHVILGKVPVVKLNAGSTGASLSKGIGRQERAGIYFITAVLAGYSKLCPNPQDRSFRRPASHIEVEQF